MRSSSAGYPSRSEGLPHSSAGAYPPAALARSELGMLPSDSDTTFEARRSTLRQMDAYALLIAATLNAGTELAIAGLGLLINERAGIVNLGAEGMMLVAAIAGFATAVHSGSDWLAFAAGMGAGALMAAAFGALVIWLNTNQYARSEERRVGKASRCRSS